MAETRRRPASARPEAHDAFGDEIPSSPKAGEDLETSAAGGPPNPSDIPHEEADWAQRLWQQ